MHSRWILIFFMTVSAVSGLRAFEVPLKDTAIKVDCGSTAMPSCSLAASELRDYLKKISGIELQITKNFDDTKSTIIIGYGEIAAKYGIKADDIPSGGFKIVVRPDIRKVFLLGNDNGNPFYRGAMCNREYDFGSLYAVYELLDRWGCRWYWPGEIGEVIPEIKSLILQDGEQIIVPDFSDRNFCVSPTPPEFWGKQEKWSDKQKSQAETAFREYRLWALRNRAGNTLAYVSRHHYPDWFALWNKKHPEYLGLYRGKRGCDAQPERSKLCTSNPAVAEAVAQLAVDYFQKTPSAVCYSICEQDGSPGFCECPKCTELNGKISPFDKLPSLSDRYALFWNSVGKIVREKCPGKYLGVYVYSRYSAIPETVKKLDPALRLVLCNGCRIDWHIYRYLVDGWGKLTPNPTCFYLTPIPGAYGSNFFSYPWCAHENISKAMKYFKEHNVAGYRAPAYSLDANWIAAAPMHYLYAKASWKANIDTDREMRDFCQMFFKEASEKMADYFKTLEAALKSQFNTAEIERMNAEAETLENQESFSAESVQKLYSPELVRQLRAKLEDALKESQTPIVRERIALFMQNIHFLELDIAASKAYLKWHSNPSGENNLSELTRICRQRAELLSSINPFSGVIDFGMAFQHDRDGRAYNFNFENEKLTFKDSFEKKRLNRWVEYSFFEGISNEKASDGTSSIKLRVSGKGETALRRNIKVIPGKEYKISYDTLLEDSASVLRMRITAGNKTLLNSLTQSPAPDK